MLEWHGVRGYPRRLTWMMNMIMGFLGSYLDGLPPSRMPPWGAALTVEEGAREATVLVTVLVTTEAMARSALTAIRDRGWEIGRR